MTVTPPPPPGSPPPRPPLGFDELVGILVAFLSLGTIFFWALGRGDRGLQAFGTPDLFPTDPAERSIAPPLFRSTDDELEDELETDPQLSEADEEEILPRRAIPGVVVPLPEERVPVERAEQAAPFTIAPVPQVAEVPETAPETAETPTFTDVSPDFWAYPFIEALAQRNIVNGFPGGYFRPDQPVTRAEFAAMIEVAFEQQEPQREAEPFTDVPADFWAVPAIERAYRIGFLEGYPGNVFRPTQSIPRVQALVALASGLDLEAPSEQDSVLQTYTDAAQIPDYATEEVAAATEAGLVANYPSPQSLEPTRDATRAEIAALIYQGLVQAGRAEPIQTQYTQPPQ